MKKNVLLILLLISASWMLKAQSYSGGDGSSGNPYQIANKTDLKYLSEHSGEWDKHFIQTADIIFDDTDFQSGGDFYNSGKGFIPIGGGSYGTTDFGGSYNGNGYSIENLFINRTSESRVGFFGRIDYSGDLDDINLINVDITGENITAALVGQPYGTINDCSSSGSVSGTGSVGGLVGQINAGSSIVDCYTTASVSSSGGPAGGFAGSSNENITRCFSTGNIEGTANVGGFIGEFSGGIISNSYCLGDVTRLSGTETSFGGFCGTIISDMLDPNPPTIEYCFSIGNVTCGDATDKGFVGNEEEERKGSKGTNTYTYNFWDSEASNQATATGATAKTTTLMKTESTFTDWDFTVIWAISASVNDGYPYLIDNAPPVSTLTWTGTTNTDWNTATNWSSGTVPIASDNIIIPDVTNDPVIVDGFSAYTAFGASLTLEAGATLTITDNTTLDLSGDLTNNGSIYVSGNTGTYAYLDVDGTFDNNGSLLINLYGDVDAIGAFDGTGGTISFTSSNAQYPGTLRVSAAVTSFGTMNNTMGTVVYNGDVAQTVIADDYYNLQLAGSSTKTIGGNLTSNNFSCSDVNTTINLGSNTLTTGGMTISNGTFNGNTGTISASGLVNMGSGFVAGTSTFRYTGSSGQGVGANGLTFYDLELEATPGSFRQIFYDLNVTHNLTQAANGELRLYDYYGDAHNLTVGGTITNNGIIKMKSGGSLLDGGMAGSGSWDIPRVITESTWHLVSSPITSATSGLFEGDYLQYWTETTGTWTDITATTDVLTPGQGYGLWVTPDKSTQTFTFTGTPNTGNVSRAITYTEVAGTGFDGANLLGNPYPSSIDWDQVSGFGAVYYWDGNAEGGAAYVAYPQTGSHGTGSQYVPPMQGFFIVIPDNDPSSFTFTNAMRTHSGATSYYKNEKSLPDGLMLYASNGIYQDKLLIRLNDEATADMDYDRDAWKLPSNTEGLSQLWSVCPEGNLSIDVRPYQETIQLGFANDEPGLYTIGISEIADITSALLEDTKANLFHDLTRGAYEFAWDVNDEENRFKLHLNVVGLEETPGNESNLLIYAANGNIFIKGAEKGEVRVSDLMGRIVLQQQIIDTDIVSIPANLKTGIYLVMVQQGSEVKTEKIFIR